MENAVEAPRMPDLPAMSAPVLANQPMRAMQPYGQTYQPPTRHLRRFLGMITGGGLALAIAVVFFQNIAKDGLRPSDLLAQFESSLELGIMTGKLPVGSDGKPITNQGEYERELAKARAAGQAEAQLEYQEKLAALQADQQRIIGAYTSLYQRTNMIAQAGLQMGAALQQAKQQMMASSQGGRQAVAMYGDIFCALGMGGCEAANTARQQMQSDLSSTQVDVGTRINELMAQVPDPASLIASTDSAENGTPHLRRRH